MPKLQSRVMFLKMCKIPIHSSIRPRWEGRRSLTPGILSAVQELHMNTHNVAEKVLTIDAPRKYDTVAQNSTWYLARSAIHSFKYSTYNFGELLIAKQKLPVMVLMRHIPSFLWNKGQSWGKKHISYTTEPSIQCNSIIFSTPSKWSSSLWLKPSRKL